MMTLSRGVEPFWINDKDAAEIGVEDNDWVEAYNDNGVVVTRAVVSARIPTRHWILLPCSRANHRVPEIPDAEEPARRRNQQPHASAAEADADGRRVCAALLSLQRLRTRRPRSRHLCGCPQTAGETKVVTSKRSQQMNVRSQVSMVFHLDKCIGCHTCSLACKNIWTDRHGAEYMWWNNVETKPGTGYPNALEDQEQYRAAGRSKTANFG